MRHINQSAFKTERKQFGVTDLGGREIMRTRDLFLRFLPYYKKYTKELVFDLCCALLTTINALVFPMIVRSITNRAVADPGSIALSWILTLGGVYLILRVIEPSYKLDIVVHSHE